MKTIYTYIFLTFTVIIYAQPKIELETTEYDFGTIATAGTIKKSFTFKNIGNEPLIISRTITGDGGSYASYPREPILPDSTGEITFVYNSKRIGPFRKCITIRYNAQKSDFGCKIRVKGEVIHRVTQIEIQKDTIGIGEIPFGTIKEVTFEVKNIGQEELHLSFLNHQYHEPDLFYQNIRPKIVKSATANKSGLPYEPNEVGNINIALRNVYGNTGKFERQFFLKYNSLDTVAIVIKGKYIGEPSQTKIYEWKSIFEYQNGQLQKQTTINYSGEIEKIRYFEFSNCTKEVYYSWRTNKIRLERYYENGILVKEIKSDY